MQLGCLLDKSLEKEDNNSSTIHQMPLLCQARDEEKDCIPGWIFATKMAAQAILFIA